MARRTRLPKMHYGVRGSRMPRVRTGRIMSVRNLGSIWQMDVRTPDDEVVTISGDARLMGDSLFDAFGEGGKLVIANVIGKHIRFTPDPIFGASSWEPED